LQLKQVGMNSFWQKRRMGNLMKTFHVKNYLNNIKIAFDSRATIEETR
jgi:hypothetical protein